MECRLVAAVKSQNDEVVTVARLERWQTNFDFSPTPPTNNLFHFCNMCETLNEQERTRLGDNRIKKRRHTDLRRRDSPDNHDATKITLTLPMVFAPGYLPRFAMSCDSRLIPSPQLSLRRYMMWPNCKVQLRLKCARDALAALHPAGADRALSRGDIEALPASFAGARATEPRCIRMSLRQVFSCRSRPSG